MKKYKTIMIRIVLIAAIAAALSGCSKKPLTEDEVLEQTREYLSDKYNESFELQAKDPEGSDYVYLVNPKKAPDIFFTVKKNKETGETTDDYISRRISYELSKNLSSVLKSLPGDVYITSSPLGVPLKTPEVDMSLEEYIDNLSVKNYAIFMYYHPTALDAEHVYETINDALKPYTYLNGYIRITVLHSEEDFKKVMEDVSKEEYMYEEYLYTDNEAYTFGEAITGGALGVGIPQFIGDSWENL